MHSRFVPAAIVSAVIAFAGAGSMLAWRANAWNFSANQTLRVATVPLSDSGRKFFAALKHEIASQHANIQMSLVETPNAEASAQALKDEKVDAAVVRSDDPAAAEGRTLFVLRNLYVTLLVPATASIDSISKLKGKKIGLLTKDAGIDPMARVVLDFYGVDEAHIVRLGLKELAASLQHKQLAAVMVVGSTGTGPIGDAIEVFRKSTKKYPKFLDVSEAKAIANRFAVYDEAEISVGAFGGSPAVPADKVTTISANLLLVARASLSNHVAGEITRLLLATKAKVAATLPEAGQLAAPSTDSDDLLLAHPGTIAFLNGERSSMLDDPTNLILLGSMLFGFLGSLAAWLRALGKKTKSHEVKRQMRRLPNLLAQVKAASPEQLAAMEQELEQLSEWLLQKFMADQMTLEGFRNAEARVGHISALIRKQRACALPDHAGDADGQMELAEAKALRNKGDLYLLPDRQRDRVVILEDFGQADADLHAGAAVTRPTAAA
jgi:TRAP transporter TAXI family solute receptor